jgi:hypothetical protein
MTPTLKKLTVRTVRGTFTFEDCDTQFKPEILEVTELGESSKVYGFPIASILDYEAEVLDSTS